ncbi:MAG: hypothetical protein M1825_002653 [Sarcosagium campestre]|nr:MAG: hypothetical protein M1825_002653 [Sarcosagium campestre]
MSESQAFFLLSVLCDRLLPGYYSTTMYGTLLDQRVFESLVEKTMPILWDHLVKSDVQLSVVSLPWFLSLYINSMPLVFAFRVLDVFFLEGPKVLFQIGLAILRINGEELLDATDDGAFISILKTYFSRLDESAHPKSENAKLRAVTRFQELMVVAFKEFSGITQGTISDHRAKYKDTVLNSIESFAKRTSIRNLGPDSKRLSVDELGSLYDRFYGVLYERQQRLQQIEEDNQSPSRGGKISAMEFVRNFAGDDGSVEKGRVGLGPSPTMMDYDGFRQFLAGIAKWAITDSPTSSRKGGGLDNHSYFGGSIQRRRSAVSPWGEGNPEPANHEFMRRLYDRWDTDEGVGLSLQNIVTGLAQVKGRRDIMSGISYFFELYDDDGDGRVDREGILRISEALLFLSRRGLEGSLSPSSSSHTPSGNDSASKTDSENDNNGGMNERFLNSVSDFIRRCFEYADPDHPQNQDGKLKKDGEPANAEVFDIGSDSEDDLLDLGDEAEGPQASLEATGAKKARLPSAPASKLAPKGRVDTRKLSKEEVQSANLALDPANPLHITLPTFRMVILADELLEQFFESSFPTSFRLSDDGVPMVVANSKSSLTTFSNLTLGRAASVPSSLPAGAGGVVPPGKGLRGVLDNIVTDGMRVATEVKRRMDDAQREIEKNALGRDDDDDDDDAVEAGGYGGEADRRSVRDADRDLLEGAEADVISIKGKEGGILAESGEKSQDLLGDLEADAKDGAVATSNKVIEFEG